MKNSISLPFLKNSRLFFSLLLMFYVLKGAFLTVLLPTFQGPDEAIHFAQMERWAEPEEPNWPITTNEQYLIVSEDIRTYHFPEEIIQTGYLTQFDEVKFQKENRQLFTSTSIGQNEEKILKGNWKQYLDIYPPTTSDTWSLYYFFGSKIEKFFSEYSVFFRFFSIRFFSVFLGAGIVALSYLIARKINFNSHMSVLFASLVAFQPMLSQTAAIINYDVAIIFSFSFFLYACILLIKDINWKHAFLVVFSAILGLFSKGPGVVLVAMLYPLFVWCSYQKLRISKKRFSALLAATTFLLVATILLVVPKSYLISITNFTEAQSKFISPVESIGKYIDKTLTIGELRDTTLSYWGQFGWLDSSIPDWSLSIVLFITIIGFIGTVFYLLSPKKIPYLPERKYIVLSLGMIIALQFAIRFYDWRVFDYTGKILIGQPGRYFLPNIVPHLLFIVTGIGFLLHRKTRFILAMKILALATILLQLHAIVNVIIPRYYL